MLSTRPWSFATDDAVPSFDAGDIFTVMDAHCGLCAKGASWIAKNDKAGEFRIIPMQSDVGNALMAHYGLDPSDPASWLFIEHGKAYTSLDAFIRVALRLGGVFRMLTVLRILPRVIQDWLYRLVARNRYRLFGRADLCAMPQADVQKRLFRSE